MKYFWLKQKTKKEELDIFLKQKVGLNLCFGWQSGRVRLMSSLLSPATLHLWDEPFDGIIQQEF